MSYRSQPLDTKQVTLPASLHELMERLAENTHDVWAEERIAQGWKFGPSRDDKALTHPGLVPYGELTESEKEFDRKTATETLKAILLLGYRIAEPKKSSAGRKVPTKKAATKKAESRSTSATRAAGRGGKRASRRSR